MRWRVLTGLVLTLAVGWSVWWLVGSRMQQAALEGWLAERQAAGWQAEARAIATSGFPSRFDTRLTDLRIANPRAGWAWQTPFLDILRLSYDPFRTVVALPPGQVFAVPGARADLDADSLRGSLRFVPGTALALERLSLEGRGLALASSAGWRAQTEALEAHVQSDGAPARYAVFSRAEAVALPDPLRALLDPARTLAAVADSAVLDARVTFDRPLDRRAVEATDLPAIERLDLTGVSLRWGDLALELAGGVVADGAGLASGQIDLRAENWQRMLEMAVEAGWLGSDVARGLEFALSIMARSRDGRSVLEVPVVFRGGLMRIGPVPVGAAPRLR